MPGRDTENLAGAAAPRAAVRLRVMSRVADVREPESEQSQQSTAEDRHASWLELFFDLIVVAGTAQLAHLLHGRPSLPDVGLFILLFLAFWMIWMCFTVYGNVIGDRARTWTMLLGMLGMAVLAASVAGVHEGEHQQAFAITYVLLRLVARRAWRRSGKMLEEWPIGQFTAGVTPWLVSIWVDGPARYWLWAAGLAIDLWTTLSASARKRQADAEARRNERTGHSPTLTLAQVDPVHLGERLGLFTLIVLGESVVQLVDVASEAGWDHALEFSGLAAFLLLVALWQLSLVHGYGGVPNLRESVLAPRLVLFLHWVTNGTLTALAAGLGAAMEHRHGQLPTGGRWVLCASLSVYFVLAVVAALVPRRTAQTPGEWGRLLGRLLPPLVLSLAIGLFGGGLPTPVVVWSLVAAAGWSLLGHLARPERTGLPNDA